MDSSEERLRNYQSRNSSQLVSNRINALLQNNDIEPEIIENNDENMEEDNQLPEELREIEDNTTTITEDNPPIVIRNLNKQFLISRNMTHSNSNIHFINLISNLDLINIVEMNKNINDMSELGNNAFYCGFLNSELKPSGYGVIINQKNEYIKGYFENGINFVRNAQSYIDKVRYETAILDGVPDGNGNIIYDNGNKYIGNITNGFPNGNGKMIYHNKSIYNGDWNMGVRQGYGEYIENDSHYQGHWNNDLKHGKGELKTDTNTILSGEWANNKKHGVFTETNSDSSNIMIQYDNDMIVYRGTHINDEVLQLKIQLEKEKDNKKKLLEERRCKICLTNEQNVVLISCGHLLCDTCVTSLDQREKRCPICRTRFTRYVNFYST